MLKRSNGVWKMLYGLKLKLAQSTARRSAPVVGSMLAVADAGDREARRDRRARARRRCPPSNESIVGWRALAVAAEEDRVGLLIAEREHGVAAAVVEIGADRQVGAEDVAVAALGDLLADRQRRRRRNRAW